MSVSYPSAFIKYAWKTNALAVLAESGATLDTWYPVLPTTTGGVRIISLVAKQDNTDNSAEEVQVKVTMDGLAPEITGTDLDDNTWYYLYRTVVEALALYEDTSERTAGMKYATFSGHSIKIEARTHSEGANQDLYCNAMFETLEAV